MAVMIAGQGRGTGTVGIAPRAQILPVTVGGSGPRSVASRCDPVLQAAVAYALGRDVVLIASSG